MGTPSWYVITGGPSSGAGKIIQELAIRGYQVVPEIARVLIDRHVTLGISPEEFRKNEAEFQQRIFREKLETEQRIPRDRIVFFERGVPDSIPYYQINGLDTQEVERVSRERYKKIFFLEQLPVYTKDYARLEDEETARRLSELLYKCYSELGYEVFLIPTLTIMDRVQMILSQL